MGLSRTRTEFALIYGSFCMVLWGAALAAPVTAAASLTAGLSFAGLILATAVVTYRYGRRLGGGPDQASYGTLALNLFLTLMAVRVLLEVLFLSTLALMPYGAPLDQATRHWFSTTWSLQVAINFALAFVSIRIVVPMATSRGTKAFAHATFS